ncbi:hypothetical protein BDR03DRAFT_955998 [Suillus americanus]|nr:hypothetical protein BDR03DRAFT_955998 [Suillus americanus]
MHCSLVFVFFLVFGFCAAQNYTLPQCAQVCAGTAATAAGCYSFSNATCVCASQPFQAAIQSCFDMSCNMTTGGTAWQYYSNLCDVSSASSAFSGQSKTTTVSAATSTSTAPRPVTSYTSSTQTSSIGSANVSSTTTSTSRSPTSTSGALATEMKMLHGFMAVVVGGALIL